MDRALAAGLLAFGLTLLPFAAQGAENDDVRQARDEVERELQKVLPQTPPGRTRIVWTGFDGEGVEANDAEFDLDDDSLPKPSSGDLSKAAAAPLFEGHLADGTHHLHVAIVVSHSKLSLLRGYRITKFRVASDVPFPASKGLEVTIEVGLHIDPSQEDPKKLLTLQSRVKPVMMAKVDDSVPAPLVAPHLAPPDAGPPPPPLPPPVVLAETETPPATPLPGSAEGHPERSKRSLATRSLGPPPPKLAVDSGAELAIADAGPPPPIDAGGLPAAVAAAPTPIPSPISPPPSSPAPATAEADEAGQWKRVAAGIGALVLLALAFSGRGRRKAAK